MPDKPTPQQRPANADWFVRGALTRIGDTFDKFLGRKWVPSSSLAASELTERIRKLLDAEAREVPGKGRVVPHHLQLKVQWNKFSTDSEDALQKLEDELLAATVDHINDSLYYTYAPLEIEIKPDFFIEGVKLMAGFDKFADAQDGAESNVTVPAINVADAVAQLAPAIAATAYSLIASFEINGVTHAKEIKIVDAQSISVGRIGSNELLIDDSSVSKTHASLVVNAEGMLSIADTGSTNGTFINDERIAYGKAMTIDADDKIKFGSVEVAFEVTGIEPEDAVIASDPHVANTVKIDGLSFTSRLPEEKPETDAATEAETDAKKE